VRRQFRLGQDAAGPGLALVSQRRTPRCFVFRINLRVHALEELELFLAASQQTVRLVVCRRSRIPTGAHALPQDGLQEAFALARRSVLVKTARLNDQLVDSQFLLRARQHQLLHRTSADEANDAHLALRSDAVRAVHGLTSSNGFQEVSSKTTVTAVWRLRPSPPAFVDSGNSGMSLCGALKAVCASARSSVLLLSSKRTKLDGAGPQVVVENVE